MIWIEAEGDGMAIRNSKELAIRLRANALNCEKTVDEVRPEHREQLLKMAQHYRMLAERAEAPSPIREPLPTSLAANRPTAAANVSEVGKSSMPPGLIELASLLELWSPEAEQTVNSG
jgi:hypothetical protein